MAVRDQADMTEMTGRCLPRAQVIEIDTPAHTLAVSKAHPEMMSDCWEWMATSRFKVSDECSIHRTLLLYHDITPSCCHR
jgi:hypothetical protein